MKIFGDPGVDTEDMAPDFNIEIMYEQYSPVNTLIFPLSKI